MTANVREGWVSHETSEDTLHKFPAGSHHIAGRYTPYKRICADRYVWGLYHQQQSHTDCSSLCSRREVSEGWACCVKSCQSQRFAGLSISLVEVLQVTGRVVKGENPKITSMNQK